MAGFNAILGHELAKEHLRKAVRYDRAAHAYILAGDRGMGKKTLAKAFAMTLLCEKGGEEPCMECHSCRQFLSENHPDMITVTHEKPASIGVEDIRAQVNDTVSIRPYSSRYKIYLIDEAEKMTVQAQNALLKTIEEPPAYVILLLLTVNPDQMLPTILSRCELIRLKPLQDRTVSRYLSEKKGLSEAQADIYAAFARGSLGRALEITSSEQFSDMMADMLRLLKSVRGMETPLLLEYVSRMAKEYPDLDECLEFIRLWYRDILMYKVTRDMNTLVFKNEYPAITRTCAEMSYQSLEQVLEAVDKAKARLDANVNRELSLELLLLAMKEN